MTECDEVRRRYERRSGLDVHLYSPLLPSTYLMTQEKERAVIKWIKTCGIEPVDTKSLLEVGCGAGGNLLDFIQLGFKPENLVGNELIVERAREARNRLPSTTQILIGDAADLRLADESFDITLQSTVFTSLLDDAFQQKVADKMWALTKPGGGILWYDFIYNNPANPDVRGVPFKRIKELFPKGEIYKWRLTLAPPISRRVTEIHPSLYVILNIFPFLRTHLLCWIRKPPRK